MSTLACASLLMAAACADEGTAAPPTAAVESTDRAVVVSTTACGHASGTTGSGTRVDDTRVLTAAHVVIGAGTVAVDGEPATVIALDPTTDLALLRSAGPELPPLRLAEPASTGTPAEVHGATSGDLRVTVERTATLVVDDVRGVGQSRRSGYVLDAAIDGGDSGAGLHTPDGLVGVVFATSTAATTTAYAVDTTEIRDFLDTASEREHACDPSRSRIVPG